MIVVGPAATEVTNLYPLGKLQAVFRTSYLVSLKTSVGTRSVRGKMRVVPSLSDWAVGHRVHRRTSAPYGRPMVRKVVFFDPTGKRARLLSRLAWVVGMLSTLVIVAFVALFVIVDRPIEQRFAEAARPSIRCAWAPTCSPAHALSTTTAVHPELLKTAAKLAEELRDKERELRAHHPPRVSESDRHSV